MSRTEKGMEQIYQLLYIFFFFFFNFEKKKKILRTLRFQWRGSTYLYRILLLQFIGKHQIEKENAIQPRWLKWLPGVTTPKIQVGTPKKCSVVPGWKRQHILYCCLKKKYIKKVGGWYIKIIFTKKANSLQSWNSISPQTGYKTQWQWDNINIKRGQYNFLLKFTWIIYKLVNECHLLTVLRTFGQMVTSCPEIRSNRTKNW